MDVARTRFSSTLPPDMLLTTNQGSFFMGIEMNASFTTVVSLTHHMARGP